MIPSTAPHRPTAFTLSLRVKAVAAAYRSQDEPSIRRELRQLAKEARLLASMDPLPIPAASVERRLLIASESERTPAGM